jgi:CubicO group peptidase (beta-lactamase class C family)
MTKLFLSTLLILGLGSLAVMQPAGAVPADQTRTDPISGRVDKLFAQWDKPDSPGCALGVIKDGKLVYAQGYGMADLEHHVPITPRTVFDIASMAKQFTGMAVLLLAHQGKLSLDDDVRRYVAEVPDYGVTVTLRHLLHHTSGLRNHFLLRQLSGWRWGDLETRADDLNTVARQKELNFKPGDEHSYTNTGYILLGEVARRVSGQSLREFASQHIFKPLSMNDTMVLDDVSVLIPGRAWGYGYSTGKHGSPDGWTNNLTRSESVGSSNLYTSVEDLARWDRNFYDGKVGGATVVAEMLKPATLTGGASVSYAAGLRLGTYKGLKLVWHAGSSAYRSEYLRFPDQHFSVICLSNSGTIDPSALARQVADLYLADLLKPEPAPVPPSAEEQAKGVAEVSAFIKQHRVRVPQETLARLGGLYYNTDNGNLRRLQFNGGKLLFERRPGVEAELVPLAADRFVMAAVPIKLEVSFQERWSDATRLMSIDTGDGHRLTLVYVGPDPAVPNKFTDYVGAFRSDEADATVTIAFEDKGLVLQTRNFERPGAGGESGAGRGWFPLKPACVDAFKNEWLGLVRFTRDPRNRITGFAVSNFAGGVRHLQFRKGRERFITDFARPEGSAANKPTIDKVDRLFAQWDRPDSPGCALAVVENGKTIYKRGYGMADLEHAVPITAQSVFDVASIAKQFTAMAVLMLVEQGKLSLDDDVRRYIPELPDYGTPITIEHLLHHTSGLRATDYLSELAGWRWDDGFTSRDALDILVRQKELNYPPGAEHSYANPGYTLLGMIVQRVSGHTLRAFTDENIFKPLGMTNTTFKDDHTMLIKNRAFGYQPENGGGFRLSLPHDENVGGGNLYSSLDDLILWDQNFYTRKVGRDKVINQMLTPGRLRDGKEIVYDGAAYGGGLRIGKYKGLKIVWHAGTGGGYRTQFLRFPDQHFSIILLCNLSSMDMMALTRQVADLYLGKLFKTNQGIRQKPPPGSGKPAAVNAPPIVDIPEKELAGLAGSYYCSADNGIRTISLKKGKLYYRPMPNESPREIELAPLGNGRFRMRGALNPVEIVLRSPPSGAPRQLVVVTNGQEVQVSERVEPAQSATAFAEFRGKYVSRELGVTWQALVRDGKLVLQRGRLADAELKPLFADVFLNGSSQEGGGGRIRFERGVDKRIIGFRLDNANSGVRNLQFIRKS